MTLSEALLDLLRLPYWGNDQDETAIDLRVQISTLFRGLKRGDCWCEMGVGNPNVSEHAPACRAVAEFLK